MVELSVAIAIALVGMTSPGALATTVGRLTEVPVMLTLVRIAIYSQNLFSPAVIPSIHQYALSLRIHCFNNLVMAVDSFIFL